MGTTASAILRIESGQHATSAQTLEKLGNAFGGRAVAGFEFGPAKRPSANSSPSSPEWANVLGGTTTIRVEHRLWGSLIADSLHEACISLTQASTRET